MRDEFALADSAGHTMIDIEAVRAADRQRAAAQESVDEDAPAER